MAAAARVGGRLAGSSAGSLRGLWTPPHPRLTVDVGRVATLRDPDDARRPLRESSRDVRVLWSRHPGSPRRYGISPLADIVGQVLRSEPASTAVAILDSMLRVHGMTTSDLWEAASQLPLTLRRRLELIDGRAESGTESIVRVALAHAGFRVIPQFRIPFTPLDRADLLVEDRIVVECDSSWHDDPRVRDRDAARDLALTALGFVVLRVRYRTAVEDPDAVVAAVTTLARRLDLRESVAI